MSATEDAMIAAVTSAEAAVQQLAAAYVSYADAYKAAAAAVYAGTPAPRNLQEKADLEHSVGSERLAQFLHGRLITLGAQRVVEQPGGMVPAGAEWTTYLINQITAHVP